MVQGADDLLLELFQPNPHRVPEELSRIHYFATVSTALPACSPRPAA